MLQIFNIIKHNWIILVFVLLHCAFVQQKASATTLKQEGDPCLIEGELRGVCTNYQLCRSAQDLITDGTRTVPCNPQTRNRNLVCCFERGRREISHDRHGSNLHLTQNEPIEIDQVETIFDAKSAYQDVSEPSRTKHSISSPSLPKRQQNLGSTYTQPNNLDQPVYLSLQTTERNSGYRPEPARRPINEHIDLNYYEDDSRGRYHSRPDYSNTQISNQRRETSTKASASYEESNQPTRKPPRNNNHRPQPSSGRETSTRPSASYEESNQSTRKPPRNNNHRPQPSSGNFNNQKPSVSSGNINKPIYQGTTHRYTQKATASPWQEAPRPLVEDGNGYSQPNFFRPEATTSVPKREKRISEMKCKEYTELVTETISGLPLTTDPKPIKISIQKCNYNAHQLIVGGQNASVGEFPHMAAIGFLDRERRKLSWNCGGTLISDNFVLTAAHCTTSSLGPPTVVRLGEHNLVRGDDGAHPVDYLVKEVVRHPEYRPPLVYNDIALLRLSRHVSFTTNIRPACLYSQPSFNTGKTIATGWGRIKYAEEQSDVLLKVVLSIIDNERCNGFYKSESKTEVLAQGITNKLMCAGELAGGKDTCRGDSGGPIEVTSQGNKCVHHVIGVTSFGKRCGYPNTPGVYTRVSAYVPWIEQVIWPELVRAHKN